MGQSTCNIKENTSHSQSITAYDIRGTKKKINPLEYIKPHNVTYDEPEQCEDLRNPKTLSIQISKNFTLMETLSHKSQHISKMLSRRQNSQKTENKINYLEQSATSQVKIKKVAVSWNKFIKMKQKRFSEDYQMMSEIGRGGFGSVYKVCLKHGTQKVYRAAKKISKNTLKKQEHQSLLEQMAIMMSLDHPNIAKLYEVYDQATYYVMVLELCEGGELFQKIIKYQIRERQGKRIMKQILSALNYMHSLGIVHRDIKPQNMLFQNTTKLIKIIDFGISSRIQKSQQLTSRVGTPYYIAPEVLMKKYNAKCDIWSLGVVLYMIIYNKPPFKGNDAMEVMKNILDQQPQFPSFKSTEYSFMAINFLKSLLARKPEMRLDAKSALNHEWLKGRRKNYSNRGNKQNKTITLSRISEFHFKNKLQAVVHTYIVSQLLTSQQKLQLLDLFHELDKNQDGVVDRQQLELALLKFNFKKIDEEKIQKIIDYVDTNCSGKIDYTQYLVSAINFKQKITEKHFEQAFQYFDIDKNGSITFQEVSQYLEGQHEINQQEIQQLFKLVDKNGDGLISKEQFVQLLVRWQGVD